jgi:hypothetical protein
MTPVQIELAVTEPTLSETGQLLRRLRLTGHYTVQEIDFIRQTIKECHGRLEPELLRQLFKQAEDEHKAMQGQGRFLGLTSFNLFKYKMDQLIENKSLRRQPR